MKRTQLNVNIDPELLAKIKESAKVSGKSMVSFVSDCFSNQITESSAQTIDTRFQMIEQRLQAIEEKLKVLDNQRKITSSITTQEEKNFNEFIKAVFSRELQRKGYISMKDAWNDLINHINCFEQWNEICSFRLKESLFIEHADPLTSEEINDLKEGSICPQPIRTGIINWINNSSRGKCCCSNQNFPTQKQICEKGSLLVEDIYS